MSKPSINVRIQTPSKSETMLPTAGTKLPFIERNVGDHVHETPMISGADLMRLMQKKEASTSSENGNGDREAAREIQPLSGEDIVKSFTRKSMEVEVPQTGSVSMQLPIGFDPRSLFSNCASRVPDNSDVDSDA